MKKSLLIALIGFMFVAFASCGGGTQEYKDYKAFLKAGEKIIDDATSCEDLFKSPDVKFDFFKEYEEGQEMTDAEEEELNKYQKEIEAKAEAKAKELCK